MRGTIALVGAALLAGACAADGTPAARRTAVPGSDCPNERRVAGQPSTRRPGPLTGDLDGDGSLDRIFIAEDPSGSERCRMFLVVLTGAARLSASVHQPGFEPALNLPALRGLADLDAQRGPEVVVDMLAGAATTFAAAFALHGGRLVRLRVDGDDPAADDLFAYGGSAGHVEGTGCVGDNVVMSRATNAAGGWRLERRFFVRRPAELVLDPARTQQRRVGRARLSALPEFAGPPFAHCEG